MFPELKLHKGRPYGTSFLNLKIKNHFYTSGRTRAILFCLTELQMIHYASAFCLRGMCSADMLLASPGSIQTYGLMDKWINQSHTMYCWEKKHHTFHSGTFTDGVTGKNESLLTKKRKKKTVCWHKHLITKVINVSLVKITCTHFLYNRICADTTED